MFSTPHISTTIGHRREAEVLPVCFEETQIVHLWPRIFEIAEVLGKKNQLTGKETIELPGGKICGSN
jgi:hypothetical protein